MLYESTVIVIDDDEINRKELLSHIEDNYNVLEAASGAEAIRLLQGGGDSFAAVLLKLNMAVLDGLGFLEEYSRNNAFSAVPVLVVAETEKTLLRGKGPGTGSGGLYQEAIFS